MYKSSSLDIFLSIILKALKMLTGKVYLQLVGADGGSAHPIRAGVGDGHAYHKRVNKSLIESSN